MLQRIQEWGDLQKVPVFQEEAEVKAGRNAELFLRDIVQSHLAYKNVHTFIGKRVPVPRSSARKEVDLIVVSDRQLHVIEVKNWSGELQRHGDKWVQVKRSGETVEYPNLDDYNNEKCSFLLTYLSDHGVELDRQLVSQKIIFMNQHLKLDPAIHNRPNVITIDKLASYLGKHSKSLSERLLFPVVEYCLSAEQLAKVAEKFRIIPSDKLEKIVALIAGISTWDRLIFKGSKAMTGDLLKIQTKSFTMDRNQIKPRTTIELHWTRAKLAGLLKAISGIGKLGSLTIPEYGTFSLSTRDFVKFHEAGNQDPTCISLSQIDHILLGR